MNYPEAPSVVVFDVYDTLALWRPAVEVMAAEHGHTITDVLAGSADIALQADNGHITYAQYGALMEKRWGFTEYVERVRQGFEPIVTMHNLAHDFYEAGSKLVIASNVGHGALRLTFEQKALPDITIFTRVLESCKLGVSKPGLAFFEHVLLETGAKPEEHLFIDDSIKNVTAAIQTGMEAALVDPADIETSVQTIRELHLPHTLAA